MDWVSPQAQEIDRLKAETALLRKKRYRNLIGLGLGAAGLAADLAGMPFAVSLVLWGMGAGVWVILKAS